MTPTELLVAALATWQAIEVWRHGEIFATGRAWVEVRDGFVPSLLLCPWCLSVWVGTLAGLWLVTLGRHDALAAFPLYGLAASRLANLGNDYFHERCRTPNRGPLVETPPAGGEDEPANAAAS